MLYCTKNTFRTYKDTIAQFAPACVQIQSIMWCCVSKNMHPNHIGGNWEEKMNSSSILYI